MKKKQEEQEELEKMASMNSQLSVGLNKKKEERRAKAQEEMIKMKQEK